MTSRSDAGSGVVVVCEAGTTRLAAGEHLVFGRDPGPGQITPDDRSVSGQHGVIQATSDGWTAQSLGSLHSFAVYDCDTPSRLMLPRGAGPVAVPFAHSVICVEIWRRRYVIEVHSSVAAPWAERARSVLRRNTGEPGSASRTQFAYDNVRWRDGQGRIYRWYQVLVAMCEPRLRVPPQDRVPTNTEIARRLGLHATKAIETQHIPRIREEFGLERFSESVRLAAVTLAITEGLVTPADLAVLELRDGTEA